MKRYDGVMTALPNWQLRARGEAILRVVRELREFVAGEEVDASLHADLDEIEAVGRWLVGAVSFQISSGIPSAGPSRPATGPVAEIPLGCEGAGEEGDCTYPYCKCSVRTP